VRAWCMHQCKPLPAGRNPGNDNNGDLYNRNLNSLHHDNLAPSVGANLVFALLQELNVP
jgi:hypothetical protein